MSERMPALLDPNAITSGPPCPCRHFARRRRGSSRAPCERPRRARPVGAHVHRPRLLELVLDAIDQLVLGDLVGLHERRRRLRMVTTCRSRHTTRRSRTPASSWSSPSAVTASSSWRPTRSRGPAGRFASSTSSRSRGRVPRAPRQAVLYGVLRKVLEKIPRRRRANVGWARGPEVMAFGSSSAGIRSDINITPSSTAVLVLLISSWYDADAAQEMELTVPGQGGRRHRAATDVGSGRRGRHQGLRRFSINNEMIDESRSSSAMTET